MKWLFLHLLAVLSLCSCKKAVPEVLGYQLISTRPHDPDAYTQGLEFLKHRLFESTGMYGESTLREVNPTSGEMIRHRMHAASVFGEGLTILNGELFVLTWKEGCAYVFEPDTFRYIRKHNYTGEGWGLTNDGKHLIMSNGTNELKWIDPKSFRVVKSLAVKDGEKPIKHLNELEWIDGQIFANVYMTEKVVRISPEGGRVTGWLDLSDLRTLLKPIGKSEVLNGIAYDKENGHLLVTGKYWPQMFELKLSPK